MIDVQYKIEKSTCDLILYVNEKTQAELKGLRETDEDFYSDLYMWDAIEHVWTNGLSNIIRPEDVGALTDAPMLCEGNDEEGEEPRGKVWCFMSYSVRSVLDDLADLGAVRWVYGGTILDDGTCIDETKVAANG